MKKSTPVLCSVLLGSITSVAAAQVVTYQAIPDSGSTVDMSPDGRYIVGAGNGGSFILDRWSGTQTFLPAEGFASCISDDGTVAAGQMDNPDGESQSVAGRWTAATGWVSLGVLPGGMGSCGGLSNSYEISADGSVICGLSVKDGCQYRGIRWTQATGLVEMDNATGNGSCRASVMSADGSLLAGFCQGSFSRTPVVWMGDGTGTVLDAPNGDIVGEVHGINDDGSKLLGAWGGQGFVFDDQGGQEFFSGVVAPWTAVPTDIADNGTIVGFDSSGLSRVAWIRPQGALPAARLTTYLTNLGVTNVPPSLDVVQAISTDGRIIIGSTFFSTGWIINLCRPDLDGDGIIGFGDLLRVLSDWGSSASSSPADLDGSGDIGFGDLLEVLSTWGPCPTTSGE